LWRDFVAVSARLRSASLSPCLRLQWKEVEKYCSKICYYSQIQYQHQKMQDKVCLRTKPGDEHKTCTM